MVKARSYICCECNRYNVFSSIAVLMLVFTHVCMFSLLCSRALKSSQHSLCSLLIVDTPGFQNPRLAKRECGATFEDLCHNYTQERLQTLFYQRTFVQELERYKDVRACAALCCVHAYCLILIIVSFFLLHLFLSAFVCSSLSDISTPIVYVFTHQIYYPSHLSQAVTSKSSSCVRPSH